MRRIAYWFCALAIVTAWPLGAETRPNFTGVWKLSEAAASAADGPRQIVFRIEHKEPVFRYEASGQTGYQPFREAFEFTTDGKAPADASKLAVTAAWEGQSLATRYVKGGKELAKFVLRLSAGGRQLTRDGQMPDGRKIHQTYDRQ